MFNYLFSTYETVEPPPIITDDYKITEATYKLNLDFLPIKITDIVSSTPVLDFNPEWDNPLSIKTDLPIVFAPMQIEKPIPDPMKLSKSVPTMNNRIISFKDKKDYAKTMYLYLYKALENNGIDGDTWAPVLTAHTSIESGWGNEFSRKNNNFAGIKGKGSGLVNTKEWSPSKGYYTIKSSFKSYPTIEDFANDYVKMLKNRFNAFEGTPEEYLKNIRSKGYFTASLADYLRSMDSRMKDIMKLLNG